MKGKHAMPKIKSLGANKTVLTLPNRNEVFFSYKTPVAAFVPSQGYFKSATKYSQTTSKHVTQWLEGVKAREVTQEIINKLAEGCSHVKL